MVSLNLNANFLFLPQSPWWSILIIALDIAVIWAFSVSRPQEQTAQGVADSLAIPAVGRSMHHGCTSDR